jgi:hypothetical protein
MDPMMMILIAVAAVLPIFNGKTLLQIVLDLLIPKPPAASAQAWEHYSGLARTALAQGDTAAAEDFAAKAAKEAARYREQEMQFEPGTIIQWIMKLFTGGAGGGMMPLLLIGGVLFLVMSGGCPKSLSPIPIEPAEAQAEDSRLSLRESAPRTLSPHQQLAASIGPVWQVTPAVWRTAPVPAPQPVTPVVNPTPSVEVIVPPQPAPPLVSVIARPAIAPCPPCPPCEVTVVRTVYATRTVQARGPLRRLIAWRPYQNFRPFGGAFRLR